MSVTLGSDVLVERQLLRGRRVGIVCNPASVDRSIRHVVDRLVEGGVRIGAIFGPQHGFNSDLQENMIETPHAEDAGRGVPIYSLYSDTREPTAEMLRGLDALVIDLQDVGTRIYTYIYTMAHCLIACARHGLPAIVCDRPNPIGGVDVEGPMLERGFESFVGEYPIPMRHGMTIGELARMFNDAFGIGAKLEVVQMRGWSRAMYGDATGLPWVMTSPNIPTLDTAIVYPGTVLFEGTNVSEGRGTTRPFEFIGAPWVQSADRFAAALNARAMPGVFFRPAVFEPTFHKHAKTPCAGCQIHVIDRGAFRPVAVGVALVEAFARAGDGFAWRPPPYEYEYDKRPIDILYGSADLREKIDAGAAADDVIATWADARQPFADLRQQFLLYE